jgi:hypothetical protein
MQNRKPPAYLEYAATILVQLPFRTMALQDRGLFYTMRLECWINKRLPQEPHKLAKILGYSVEEVAGSLDAVMPFFNIVDGFLISPELEDYREYLAERRRRQSKGGKRGSAITNSKRRVKTNDNGTASNSQVPCQGSDESLVKSSTDKPSQTQSIKKEVVPVDDPWVKEYEKASKCF